MKKNFLFKGVAMLGAISLLANTVLPGLAYADVVPVGSCTGDDAVAQIGDSCYASLGDAIEVANGLEAEEVIIELKKDAEVTQSQRLIIERTLTINGNGYTINGSSAGNIDHHNILVKGNGDVTLNDLFIKNFGNEQPVNYELAIAPLYTSVLYGGNLTLNNVGIENFNRQAIVIGGGNFKINNCVFTGKGEDETFQQGILIYNGSGTITNTDISGIRAGSNSDTYGILLAGDGIVDINGTDIFNSDGAVAVSPTDAPWKPYLASTYSSGKITLGEGNNFEGTDNVIAIVPMGTDEDRTDSTIEVTAGTYSGVILIDEDIDEEGGASIQIKGGEFSADPSAYLADDYCTADIDGVYPVGRCVEITIADGIENGTVTITKPVANASSEYKTIATADVIFTAVPSAGYSTKEVKVGTEDAVATERDNEYSFEMSDTDVEISAVFSQQFTVNFYSGDGLLFTGIVVWSGKTVELEEEPEPALGYEFSGWYLNEEEYNFDEPVIENLEIIAKYKCADHYNDIENPGTCVINTGSVTYKYEGTTPSGASDLLPAGFASVDFGEEVTVDTSIAANAIPGWTFNGWTTEDAAVSEGKFDMPDNSVVLKGTWTIHTGTVTYVYEGDAPDVALPAGGEYNYGAEVTVAGALTADGWTFNGWTTPEGLTVSEGKFSMPDENVVITGTWTIIPYTIAYELNGGTLPAEAVAPVSYNVKTAEIKVTNPNKRDDYKFIGWSGTDLESPVTTLIIPSGSTGDRSYEVVWEAIGGESSTPGAVDEKVVPDAGTQAKTGAIDASLDNAIVVEQFNADDYSGTAAPTTPTVVIQQKEADAAYSEEGTSESKLESEFQGFVETTGMIADVNGILDVQLVYVDTDGSSTPMGKVNFSEPVRVYIPVNGASSVRIRVKHTGESSYGTGGLTTNANAKCNTDGTVQSPDEYTGGEIPVNNGKALIYTCSASSFVAYSEVKPAPAPSYSGGGGGGGSSKKSETNTGLVTTGAVENATGSTETLGEENKDETVNENNEGNTAMTDDAAVAKFGQEQIDAYKWALQNGITTMKTVEEARLDQPLTRAELAKMMVVYVAKVLEKQPVITGDVSYQDVDANKLGDLAGYIKLAYQYQIMGINADGTPIDFFNPNGLVTRGEYATVFSRVLFGSKFNKEGADFYTNHLEALKAAGILSNTEPTIKEMRGWVMLMMYRSSKNIEAIEKVAAEVEATDEEVAEAEAKAEEEASEETTTEENTENAEATTGDVAEAPEAEATTGDVVEAPEAEATTGDVAETPAEASTGDTASN